MALQDGHLDTGAVCGGRYPEAGWLSADRSCSLKSPRDQERLGWAGIGAGVGRGYPEPQPHPQSFTRPPTPQLQMGDLRALPGPMRKALPSLDIQERGHLNAVWSTEEGVYHLVLFCGD